jgi:hypothetical protein
MKPSPPVYLATAEETLPQMRFERLALGGSLTKARSIAPERLGKALTLVSLIDIELWLSPGEERPAT